MTKEGTLIRSALFIFSKRLQQRSFAPAYLRALPLHPDFIHQQPQIAVAKARRAVAELPPQRLAEGGQGFRIQRVELHETLSALISHSGCDKGQLARLVGGLRERGLLDGRADENDRRNLLLHLTPGGGGGDNRLAPYSEAATFQLGCAGL